jgi:hypothetical protein
VGVVYGTDTAITFDVSSLATSATFVAGRESTQIDNTSNLYNDAQVYCDGITAGASALTIGQMIRLYVWGSTVSLATTAIDTLDGTDSAETLTHVAILNSLRLVDQAVATETNANRVFYFQPFAVAQFFGGVLPPFWGLFVAHNHAGSLAASQSGIWSYRGITYS